MQMKILILMQTNLKEKIAKLKKEKNAVVLGHYYQRDEVQEVSDFVGDSLALAQIAKNCDNDIIVFCGVHFMAETAKILNPKRKVLIPDMSADCSLARSCDAKEFVKFKEQHPDHLVISYINCSAEIKALSDIICTSGNAVELVKSLPQDQKIIFAPDKNLGGYINKVTGRNMLLWNGVCTVHDAITVENVMKKKSQYADAPIISHPECSSKILDISDFVGSTKAMLNFIKKTDYKQYIVVTESGILYQMKLENPNKEFIAVEGSNGCSCVDCVDMKFNTLEKLYDCLDKETPEILMSDEMIAKAVKPIDRMLEISKQLGIIK